jgi:putative component of toxin-antitoxin plasmid stabilization module
VSLCLKFIDSLFFEQGGKSMTEDLREKLGVVIAKADAAHSRIDKLEVGLREDLKDLKSELKELNAHMHKGKGWAGAMLFMAGLAGGGLAAWISSIFQSKGG